jgi:hypothetical protein
MKPLTLSLSDLSHNRPLLKKSKSTQCRLKETVSRDFRPLVFSLNNTVPSRSLIHALKYFRISLRIRREINEYVLPRAMQYSVDFFVQNLYEDEMCGPAPALCHIARDKLAQRWINWSNFRLVLYD